MIDITKEQLSEVAADLSEDIAKSVVLKYTQNWFMTGEEAEALQEIVASLAALKISNVIGGYCSF